MDLLFLCTAVQVINSLSASFSLPFLASHPVLKKKEKPKKEEAKKEEPEEMDAADEALLEEPKSKDPFDEMPKGTFNMDDFKRFYSNNEESKSIPYFWDKFDKENYSIWFGEYKYSDELTKVFMSCNLISGKFCYYVLLTIY